MKKLYITFALLSAMFYTQAQYSWINKNAFPGTGRVMATGFAINGTGYLVGGFTQYSSTWVNEVWSYNPVSDSWTQKNNFPAATANAAHLSFDTTEYVIGGYMGGGNNSGSTYMYQPSSDSWASKSSFPGGGIGGVFQFVVNGIGYVGTGERPGANNSSTAYAYNPSADSWTSIANYPESIVNGVSFSIDSLGYVGLGSDGSYDLSTGFYKYSPSTNTWTPIAPFPGEPRSSAMAFVINGIAYVGEGWTTVPSSQGIIYDLGDFYAYDPSTDTWTSVPGLPGRGRQLSAAFVVNNNGYIVDGLDDYISQTITNVAEFGTCGTIASILPVSGGSNAKSDIEIYPNPSTTSITIKIGSEVTSEVKYQVVSIDGKVIKKGTTLQNTFNISDNGFSDGLYILTITDGNGIQGEQRFEVIH